MTTSSPMQPAPGAVIAGKYRLTSLLARGGMGAVWTATHVELGVPVAIKVMDPAYASSPVAQARFAREAKASATLRHPNIVDVRDYGVDNGVPYLVMELLRGEDLGQRLRKVRRLSLEATAAVFAQLARALRGAHEAGLVHRDLKPSNIFLARIDDEEVVKILDFGIAKDTQAQALAGESTRTGEIMGSPHYMSPEQIRGARDLDAGSDIWSLGVIAFRCLTGELPFRGEVVGAVIAQILADPIPQATQVAPDLPPAVDAFLARALNRDRAARFHSVREMATALASLAGVAATSGSFSLSGSIPVAMQPLDPRTLIADPRSEAPSQPDLPTSVMHQVPAEPRSVTTFTGAGTTVAPRPGPNRAALAMVAVAVVISLVAIAVFALRTPSPPQATAAATPSASVSVTTSPQAAPTPRVEPAEQPAEPAHVATATQAASSAAPAEPAPTAKAATPAARTAPATAKTPAPVKTSAPTTKSALPPVGF